MDYNTRCFSVISVLCLKKSFGQASVPRSLTGKLLPTKLLKILEYSSNVFGTLIFKMCLAPSPNAGGICSNECHPPSCLLTVLEFHWVFTLARCICLLMPFCWNVPKNACLHQHVLMGAPQESPWTICFFYRWLLSPCPEENPFIWST